MLMIYHAFLNIERFYIQLTLKQDAQSWTALFRAFSSHRQPSASLTKLFPSCNFLLHNDDKQTQHVTIVFKLFSMLINCNVFILWLKVFPADQTSWPNSYSPAGQDSWPNWTNLKGLHSGREFLGNKQFFTCGT